MDVPAAATIAFLFTDIEGSTRLWERFPDGMQVALGRHDAILRDAIEASGGEVVKTTGDGMMAVFGNAVAAAAAGLAAQRELGAEPWGETGPLRVRMGIHCGQAEPRGGDYFGPTVNRTARIMAVGHGGQVLLSGAAGALVAGQLPDGAGLLDLGEHHLKDLGRPEHLLQLVHPDLPSGFPPLATSRAPGSELPARVAGVIGRRDEIARVSRRLEDGGVRLLTLTGPGGTGKTTLAIRVAGDLAARFRDGVAFVDLSGARDPNAVLVSIARAVGLGEIIDRPLLDELVDFLRDRRMLLVLDNLEQVTSSAGIVAQLLGECPQLTVLATSRQPLNLRAEQVHPVPPLALPPAVRGPERASEIGDFEAVQLFVDRARVVLPGFELTDDNAPAVAEICRRLDGLPLAIELAAARLRLFSPEILRDRLGDRLGLLRSGPRDLPERQQTLRAAMDWSYRLLEPGEQRLFELMAVFADAEIGAVEAVADDLGEADGERLDVLDGLAGLVEKSLLRRVDRPGGEPRVAMLETIREFARDRLAQRPELAAAARHAHAVYYGDLAARLRPDLTGGGRELALDALGADVANLRLAWATWVEARDLERLEGLAGALMILDDAHGWYLDTIGLATDLLAVLDAVPSSAGRIGQEIALRTTLARALLATKGPTPEVEAAFAGALELFERGADLRQQFPVLRGLASLYLFRGQLDESARLGQQILELGEAEGDAGMRIAGNLLVGTTLMSYHDLRAGLDRFDRAIALFPHPPTVSRTARVGNDSRASSLTTSAITLWLLGYPERAAARVDAALALAAQLDHPFTTAYARFHAGLVRLFLRDPEVSLELATGLLELAGEHELRIWTAVGGCLLGASQVEVGRDEEGLANLRTGMDRYGELRSPPIFWPFLLFLEARALARAARPAEGLRALEAALAVFGEDSGLSMLPEMHILKGDLVAAMGDRDGVAGDGDGVTAVGEAAAETWYRRALDRAVELDARMAQLRAATRLARLELARGRPATAEDLLRPIHASFTEGFERPDLREAAEVLRQAGAPGP